MMGNKRTPQTIGGLVLAGVVTVAGITAALPGETSTVQAALAKTATGAQTKACTGQSKCDGERNDSDGERSLL
ncbi:hypothetical protein [Brevibacillus borstelensis]|uniref:hypothetical protein n=1 Tax=Brevibacillus borstelensis TaxID=45462 RepID=UPI003D1FCC6E